MEAVITRKWLINQDRAMGSAGAGWAGCRPSWLAGLGVASPARVIDTSHHTVDATHTLFCVVKGVAGSVCLFVLCLFFNFHFLLHLACFYGGFYGVLLNVYFSCTKFGFWKLMDGSNSPFFFFLVISYFWIEQLLCNFFHTKKYG